MALTLNRLTPDFRYNPEAQRFVASNGQFVSRETVNAAVEAVSRHAQTDIEAVSLRFQNGEISHTDWDAAMRLANRRLVLAESALACGGWDNMTPKHWGRAGALIQEQDKYLNGFGERIQSGYYGDDLSKAGFMAHARLYGKNGHPIFQYVQGMNALEDLGHNEIANELGGNERDACRGPGSCQAMSDLKWLKVDGEVFKKVWRWPGDRLCLNQCRCRAKTRQSENTTTPNNNS